MARNITVRLGDDDNKNYSKTITMLIPTKMHRILSNFEMDQYDDMWDSLCDMIGDANDDLPRNWFIDKITW